MVPGAQTALLLGLNQVVMLSFSTVILAALVGAQGVGNDVLIALQRLAIGRGLEAGLAITLVAIVLDRFFHALVVRKRQAAKRISAPLFWGTAGGAALGLTLLSFAVPQLAHFPDEWTISTANTVDVLVSFLINIIYTPVTAVQTVVIIYGLMPLKHGLEALPWAFVTGVVFIFAYLAGGLRRAIELSFLVSLIAFAGLWDRAMQTFYLSFMGVALAAAAGFPLGILAAKHPRLGQIILPLTDTLQTLPGFIYLIPAIMLFGTGDVPCIFAISAFAICPAIRYTEAALRNQPRSLDEVGRQFGCGPLQRLFKIELPAALPQLLLGLSQVVLMALAMVVVTSLIGTTDLGEAVMLAVNQADSGQALAAGIAVAIIGIVVDRLLTDRANLIIKQRSRAK
jgi:glycine betaine/proline transport system permease protein